MEDWAYGGSTKPNLMDVCKPEYQEFRANLSKYENYMLNAFVLDIFVDKSKQPDEKSKYGSSEGVTRPGKNEDGIISRNIRLALHFAKAAAPYYIFKGIKKGSKQNTIEISWAPGGCFKVNKAWVQYWNTYHADNLNKQKKAEA